MLAELSACSRVFAYGRMLGEGQNFERVVSRTRKDSLTSPLDVPEEPLTSTGGSLREEAEADRTTGDGVDVSIAGAGTGVGMGGGGGT